MIKLTIGKKDSLPAVFVQYGIYIDRKHRGETHFEVIYGLTRDEIEKAIEEGIEKALSEKKVLSEKKAAQ